MRACVQAIVCAAEGKRSRRRRALPLQHSVSVHINFTFVTMQTPPTAVPLPVRLCCSFLALCASCLVSFDIVDIFPSRHTLYYLWFIWSIDVSLPLRMGSSKVYGYYCLLCAFLCFACFVYFPRLIVILCTI